MTPWRSGLGVVFQWLHSQSYLLPNPVFGLVNGKHHDFEFMVQFGFGGFERNGDFSSIDHQRPEAFRNNSIRAAKE
jgi:hypothetical protein